MFSRWIVTNIISDRGTLHCRKTRIHCGNQVVICELYTRLVCSRKRLHILRNVKTIWIFVHALRHKFVVMYLINSCSDYVVGSTVDGCYFEGRDWKANCKSRTQNNRKLQQCETRM
jgi:hypothetical protein